MKLLKLQPRRRHRVAHRVAHRWEPCEIRSENVRDDDVVEEAGDGLAPVCRVSRVRIAALALFLSRASFLTGHRVVRVDGFVCVSCARRCASCARGRLRHAKGHIGVHILKFKISFLAVNAIRRPARPRLFERSKARATSDAPRTAHVVFLVTSSRTLELHDFVRRPRPLRGRSYASVSV